MSSALEATPDTKPAQPHELTLSVAKTRKPRVWTAFATLLVAATVGEIAIVLGCVAVGIVTGIIMGAQGADPATIQASVQEIIKMPLPALLLSLVPFQLGMTVVVLFAAWRSKEPLKERLGLVPQSGRTFGGVKLATMAAFTMATALAAAVGASMVLGPPAENTISVAITSGSWLSITLLSIVLSVIPALVEESLFRGYIQRRFLQRWSPAVAIILSTFLFSIMHMDSLQHIIAVVPLGLIVGILAHRTNSVKPGMVVHAVHNAAAVGFGALTTALTPTLGQEGVGVMMIGTIVVLFFVGLPAVISLLRNAKPQVVVQHSVPAPSREPRLSDSWLAGQAV